MATTTKARRQYAQLNFNDGEILVSPPDRDLFFMNARRATEACREAVQLDGHIARFEADFLTPLHDWCLKNAGQVRACFYAVPGREVEVFVVTKSRRFDFEFAEAVAALERELAAAGWRVSVMQLPDADDESLATFFRPEGALQIYAEGGPAPGQVGT